MTGIHLKMEDGAAGLKTMMISTISRLCLVQVEGRNLIAIRNWEFGIRNSELQKLESAYVLVV
ncbi:hypothetical protein H6F43_16150 [Leptolyngbya sp. FACHB-36]|uniref:hypothetical protein n=1 Tax=Leptolyngbya sp. FACHB-36 TaxID=2692808 RepID=UPI00167FE49A|nr:hypothetical protein [Leptolyngbya sp. FACHB-36]MBD2021713.1 hypothetical protein [Leptolyngbya sp. FACHB-36]